MEEYTDAVKAAVAAYEDAVAHSLDPQLVAKMDALIAALTPEEHEQFGQAMGGSAR